MIASSGEPVTRLLGQALAATAGQAGEDLLELGDVAGHHGQQVVGLAREVVRRDDLRQRPYVVFEDGA